ncbi:MAG: sulfatase [Thermoanaerobaculia bacterium]|nr:sulfatase [Thermoanaerobaculia bacterium]
MNPFRRSLRPLSAALCLTALALAGCTRSEPVSDPVRLVHRFADARVADSPPAPEPGPPTEWTFTGGKASGGDWAAGPRATDLRLTDAGLAGRAKGPFPAVILTLPEPVGDGDVLHEVVLRLRVTAGSNLSFATLGAEGPPTEALVEPQGDLARSVPLLPGDEVQSYSVNLDRSFGLGPMTRSGITRLLLRPTDEAGAEFTIESVRLVFRKEHLASIPSGIGWHGLAQVWRDTVISRAPERITWTVDLPATDPWLDVALGTVSLGPVGFEVSLTRGSETQRVYRETVTTAERWNPRRIDLSPWAGRRVDLTLAADGAAGALAFWGSPVVRSGWVDDREPETARGVIVVLADTLRKHHLALYGHERPNTPNLQRMAEGGVLFSDAISQATWTKVSVPSLLSSLYPTTHEIVSFNDRLPAAAVTLAEALQGAGFATWASSSVPFSGQLTNLHQGVEVLHEEASVVLPEGVSDSKTGRHFVDELIPWLERHRDVPFFAFVHAMDPHSPFEPYAPYDTLWTDAAAAERWERDLEEIRPHIESPVLRRFGMPTRAEMEAAGVEIEPYLEHERAWYDASILALDAEIGRLLETLQRLGRDTDTVIAFVSDHGEEFLEHGNHWHGLNVYAEMIEVPLLFHWPAGLPGGTVVDSTVRTIDMMPTLLELAGVPLPPTVQGAPLSPLWEEGARTRRPGPPAVAERKSLFPPDAEGLGAFAGSDSLAIVEPEWKLIWNVRPAEGTPELELYHRPSDPLDQKNVAAEHPDQVERLRALLEQWERMAVAARLPSDEEAAKDLSAEDLERLKSLGYL